MPNDMFHVELTWASVARSVRGSCGTIRLNELLKFQNSAARIVTNDAFDWPVSRVL